MLLIKVVTNICFRICESGTFASF